METTVTLLDIDRIDKRFPGACNDAVHRVSLSVRPGEILALLGESGSGKTTLLRLIAGLEAPDAGRIALRGKTLCDQATWVPPERRGMGMVFQDYALFPHLTVARNIAFGLRQKNTRDARIRDMIACVGLCGKETRYPHELSGGEQQRVALARALAPEPALLLLDEPFSNLDERLKDQVRRDVRAIIRQANATAIFVTHDTRDALATADRLALMQHGRIQQIGTPQAIYHHPANAYVAQFFGQCNLLPATPADGGYQTPFGRIAMPSSNGASVRIAIRPAALSVSPPDPNSLSGLVDQIAFCGAHQEITLAGTHAHHLIAHLPISLSIRPGDTLHLKPDPEALCVLSD